MAHNWFRELSEEAKDKYWMSEEDKQKLREHEKNQIRCMS